jgi:hypothetical protein
MQTSRIPELDGLRGIAIGMVIVWHYFSTVVQASLGSSLSYLVAATRLTWSGVDLFFVLSGFLIGGILLDAREATNYFRVFYRRRFFRIVPIYAAVLLIFPILASSACGTLSPHRKLGTLVHVLDLHPKLLDGCHIQSWDKQSGDDLVSGRRRAILSHPPRPSFPTFSPPVAEDGSRGLCSSSILASRDSFPLATQLGR